MKSLFLISLFAFLLNTISYGQEKKISFQEQYDVSKSPRLEIFSSDGDIQVRNGKEDIIEVYYIVHKGNNFLKISMEELIKHVDIEISHTNDLLDISVKNLNKNNWNNQYNVSFEVLTPKNTSCVLVSSDGDIEMSGLISDQKCKTSDGDISIIGINGNLELITSDGDIEANDIRGDMVIETSDGDIRAENIEGESELITSDGDISIEEAVGAFKVVTSDGDIEAHNISGSMSAVTSDGDIQGNFLKVMNKLSCVTSDGDISISIPNGLGMNLKLKGETLKIPKINLSGNIDEHHIEGEVNGGGIPVELITSDGTIILSYQ